jgi:Xaa-Pro aminopeptidase
MLGIEAARPGRTFGDIGAAIQSFVEGNRMSVVRDFCGHGLGRVFHAPPNVLHYGRPGTGPRLEEGMFFTIEPMVNLGSARDQGAGGRLDGGDAGQVLVGAVRAFGGDHRHWGGGVHRLARGAVRPRASAEIPVSRGLDHPRLGSQCSSRFAPSPIRSTTAKSPGG